jgi:hypothetical protein
VVLEDGIRLPEDTIVKVEPVEEAPQSPDDPLYRLAELAGPTGIPDLAMNIDSYLYGHPKVNHADE